LIDLAKAGAHQEVIDLMYDRLLEWGLRMSQRITLSDTQIATRRGKSARKGILLGVYEPSEVDDTLTEAYRRPIPKPTS